MEVNGTDADDGPDDERYVPDHLPDEIADDPGVSR